MCFSYSHTGGHFFLHYLVGLALSIFGVDLLVSLLNAVFVLIACTFFLISNSVVLGELRKERFFDAMQSCSYSAVFMGREE